MGNHNIRYNRSYTDVHAFSVQHYAVGQCVRSLVCGASGRHGEGCKMRKGENEYFCRLQGFRGYKVGGKKRLGREKKCFGIEFRGGAMMGREC